MLSQASDTTAKGSLTRSAATTAGGYAAQWRLLAARSGALACALAVGVLFGGVVIFTWKQWTVQAFPLDAGREMLVPRLMIEGRRLFTDIRCSHGPLGYWLNAGLLHLGGVTEGAAWWCNFLRFAATVVVLWRLARQLLSPWMAVLSLGSWIFPLFFSFMVPYSAGTGWGTLFLAMAVLCFARWFKSVESVSFPGSGWLVAGGLCLSAAALCKQEYALSAAVVLCGMVLGLWLEPCRARARFARIVVLLTAAALPLSVATCYLLATVPWHVLIYDNLWMVDLIDHYGGAWKYGPGSALGPRERMLLLQLVGLAAAAAAALKLVPELFCWWGRPAYVATERIGRRGTALALVVLAAGLGVAAAADSLLGGTSLGAGLLAFAKPRPRELVESASLLCLPLTLMLMATTCISALRRGMRAAWLSLAVEDRIAVLCGISYLAFIAREVPTAIELTRQPFTPVLLIWLLTRFVPRQLHWNGFHRQAWLGGTAIVLLAATLFGLDNIRYYQSRPSVVLSGPAWSMYAWQRRKPFEPRWFQEALQTVQRNVERIADRPIACVPQGAWVNALLGLNWSSRDPQWEPSCLRWVLEDLEHRPPDFVFVMDPVEMERDVPPAYALIRREYQAVDGNSLGMVLYERRPRGEDPTRRMPTDITPLGAATVR